MCDDVPGVRSLDRWRGRFDNPARRLLSCPQPRFEISIPLSQQRLNRKEDVQRMDDTRWCTSDGRNIGTMAKNLWAMIVLGVIAVLSANNTLETANWKPSPPAKTVSQPLYPLILLGNTHDTYCQRVKRSRLYSPECNHTKAAGSGFLPHSPNGTGSNNSQEEQPPRLLLVTGTGRSGTTFLAVLLRWMDLKIAHDSRASTPEGYQAIHGAVSWIHAFDQTDKCELPEWAGFRRRRRRLELSTAYTDRRNFVHVAHVVRNPLDSIRSRWNLGVLGAVEEGNCHTVQADFSRTGNKTQDTLRVTLRHWVLWNSFVESIADGVVYKSEELSMNSTIVLDLVRQAGLLGEVNSTQEQLQDFLNENTARLRSTNAAHTKKPKSRFTWQLMADIDVEYATMAQMMALRYGYFAEPGDLNLVVGQDDIVDQTCGFVSGEKWSCSLARRENTNSLHSVTPRQ